MDGFSFSEIVIIIIIAIIIYGKDLPQAARKLATLYTKFKRQLSDVRDEISRQIGSTPGNIRSILTRARQALKDCVRLRIERAPA